MTRLLAAALLVLLAANARADGAFPDELQLFLPESAPATIVLSTNFGLLRSDDSGATWNLVCEANVSGAKLTSAYQLGLDGTLYAASQDQVGRSSDQGCSWTAAPFNANSLVTDLFADPVNAARVFAIDAPVGGTAEGQVYVSLDSAQTFNPLLAASGAYSGVESARTDPTVIYLASARTPDDGGAAFPLLLRSIDGGWIERDHPELSGSAFGIAAVDPLDADAIYLRVQLEPGHDELGISLDGAQTVNLPLDLGDAMSSFARGSDGTLYVGSRRGHLWVGGLDGGFVERASPLLRCLGERSGILYACGDDIADGFALATSTDHGQSFTPLLRFQDVQGLASCGPVQAACVGAWQNFANVLGISVDAGSQVAVTPPPPAGKGCGCGAPGADVVLFLGVIATLLRRRARG